MGQNKPARAKRKPKKSQTRASESVVNEPLLDRRGSKNSVAARCLLQKDETTSADQTSLGNLHRQVNLPICKDTLIGVLDKTSVRQFQEAVRESERNTEQQTSGAQQDTQV